MYKLFNKLQSPTGSVSGSGSVPTGIETTREELVKNAVALRQDSDVYKNFQNFFSLRAIERILADEVKLSEFHKATSKPDYINQVRKNEILDPLLSAGEAPVDFFNKLTYKEKLELEFKDKKENLGLLPKTSDKTDEYAQQYFEVAARERILASPEKLSKFESASNRNEIIDQEKLEIEAQIKEARKMLLKEQRSLMSERKNLNEELKTLSSAKSEDIPRITEINERNDKIDSRIKDIKAIIKDPQKIDEHAKKLAEEEKKRKDAEEKAKAVTLGAKAGEEPEPSRDLDDEYKNSKRKKNEMIDEMNFQNQKALRILSNSSHSDNWIVQMFNAGHRLGKAMPFILKGRAIKEEIEGLENIEKEYDKYGAQANIVQSKLDELSKNSTANKDEIEKCKIELNRLKEEQTRVFDKVLQVRYQHIQQTEEYNKIHPKRWYHTEAERVNMFVEPGQQAGGILKGKRSYASRALSMITDPLSNVLNPVKLPSNVMALGSALNPLKLPSNLMALGSAATKRLVSENTPDDLASTGIKKIDNLAVPPKFP